MSVVVCLYLPPPIAEKNLQALAEACLQVSPQIALGRHWLFIEIGKCKKIFSKVEAQQKLVQLCSLFVEDFSLALSQDLSTALALAKYQMPEKSSLPISALTCYLDPFKQEDSLQKEVALLQSLGLHQLQDLDRVSLKEFTSRFDKKINLALLRYHKNFSDPWPHFKLSESFSEYRFLSHEQSVVNLEPLLFILKPMVQRLCQRLRGRGLKMSLLKLSLKQETYSLVTKNPRNFSLKLNFSTNDENLTLDLLRERLQAELQSCPLEAQLIEVELQVLESIASRFIQKDFFTQAREWQEAQQILLNRLSQKLGDTKVFYTQLTESYLPEKAWQPTLKAKTSFGFPFALRPLRLFHPPRPVTCSSDYIFTSQQRWRLEKTVGPEVINTQWWDQTYERKYYVAHCKNGHVLWLFQSNQQTFLHGVFD